MFTEKAISVDVSDLVDRMFYSRTDIYHPKGLDKWQQKGYTLACLDPRRLGPAVEADDAQRRSNLRRFLQQQQGHANLLLEKNGFRSITHLSFLADLPENKKLGFPPRVVQLASQIKQRPLEPLHSVKRLLHFEVVQERALKREFKKFDYLDVNLSERFVRLWKDKHTDLPKQDSAAEMTDSVELVKRQRDAIRVGKMLLISTFSPESETWLKARGNNNNNNNPAAQQHASTAHHNRRPSYSARKRIYNNFQHQSPQQQQHSYNNYQQQQQQQYPRRGYREAGGRKLSMSSMDSPKSSSCSSGETANGETRRCETCSLALPESFEPFKRHCHGCWSTRKNKYPRPNNNAYYNNNNNQHHSVQPFMRPAAPPSYHHHHHQSFPCHNRGCQFRSNDFRLLQMHHQFQCLMTFYPCPAEKCTFQGQTQAILSHLHGVHSVKTDPANTHKKWAKSSGNLVIQAKADLEKPNVFHTEGLTFFSVFRQLEGTKMAMHYWLWVMGPLGITEKYGYNFRIMKQNQQHKISAAAPDSGSCHRENLSPVNLQTTPSEIRQKSFKRQHSFVSFSKNQISASVPYEIELFKIRDYYSWKKSKFVAIVVKQKQKTERINFPLFFPQRSSVINLALIFVEILLTAFYR